MGQQAPEDAFPEKPAADSRIFALDPNCTVEQLVRDLSDFRDLVMHSYREHADTGPGTGPPELMVGTARHGRHVYVLLRAPADTIPPLSPRETEIAHLVAAGLGNKQIAARLGIRLGSVEAYLQRVFHKWRVNSRVQVAVRALFLP